MPKWSPLLVLGFFFSCLSTFSQAAVELPHVVFIAGNESHSYGEHEFNAGGEILVADLNQSGVVRATLYRDGWPVDGIDKDAAAIVLYMDGDGGHLALQHMDELRSFMRRGVGLFAMHFAVHVPEQVAGTEFTQWLGGYYHSDTSTNPIWRANVDFDANEPFFNGVNNFTAVDEFYFNIRFDNPNTRSVLKSTPPPEAREHVPHPRRIAHAFGGTPPAEVVNNPGRVETLAWSLERPDGGRGFGFTGGHYHWNWGNTDYRRFVLNAIVWTAKATVPKQGVPTALLTVADLKQGQDEEAPFFFNEQKVTERFGLQSSYSVPADAFHLPDDLKIELWAASPLLYNPTNIDIDAEGRVWVAEGWNYRRMPDKRPEGDRVVVLTDSNGDGKADRSHTFVQDPELRAPLGVAVVDNKVYVSQPPHLIEYTDVNRDLVFDPSIAKRRNLLSGFGGYAHDHRLHSVTW